MNIAFLIQAHNQPEILSRFMKHLHGYGDIYLHLDKRVDQTQFLQNYPYPYQTIPNIAVRWGGDSILRSFLNLLQQAISTKKYDYLSIHSGVDYPTQPIETFLRFLRMHKKEEFVEAFPMPLNNYFRFEKYHLAELYSNYRENNIQSQIIRKIEKTTNLLLPRRKHYKNLLPIKGANWCTISYDFASALIKYWNDHPEVQKYTYFMLNSDRWYIQTIGTHLGYQERFSPYGYLRYINWDVPNGPKNLTLRDLPIIQSSKNCFFTRKLTEDSFPLMDALDQIIFRQI